MGYVFGKISDLKLSLPKSGLYLFLKASDQPLGPFYNEHRDRRGLFTPALEEEPVKVRCLDRSQQATFDDGWFEPNLLPPVARWMGNRSRVSFVAGQLSEISLDLTTHIPDLRTHPLGLEIRLNGVSVCAFSLFNYSWLNVRISVPKSLSPNEAGKFEMEILADRTWQPRPSNDESRDDRELSIAVCNIVVSDKRQNSS
jgi:hypothetical protein